jgi:hypothetical protein
VMFPKNDGSAPGIEEVEAEWKKRDCVVERTHALLALGRCRLAHVVAKRQPHALWRQEKSCARSAPSCYSPEPRNALPKPQL